MLNTSMAPKCRSGYRLKKSKNAESSSNSDSIDEPKFAIFLFPAHDRDPDSRKKWIAKVPRESWRPLPTAKHFLCEEEFTRQISRGCLTKPSEYLYTAFVYSSSLYRHHFPTYQLNPNSNCLRSVCN